MRNPIEILNTIQRESSISKIRNLEQAMINYNNGTIMAEPISNEEMEETLKFFNIDSPKDLIFDLIEPKNFFELDENEKTILFNNLNNFFKYGSEKIHSVILFSNPNSGKTKYLHSLMESCPKMNLSLKNTKNPTEWQEKIFIQNIARDSFFGPILKMVANSTIYNDIPHFIYEDEVGEFELDFVLGPTIKSIFKSDQRINISNLIKNDIDLKNKFEEIKKNKRITLNQYIDIGNILKNKFPYETTVYKYNELEIPLWIPENLYFIFTSNYELGIAKSLYESKGWNKNGKRFYPKQLYTCGNIKDNNLVQIQSPDISEIIIDFNEKFLNSAHKLLEFSSLAQEDKEEFKLKIYEFLVPNFYQFNLNNENEQKNELKERLKSLLYNSGFQDLDAIMEQLIY